LLFCYRYYPWSIGLKKWRPKFADRHDTKVWRTDGDLLELIAFLLYNLIISLEIGFLIHNLVLTMEIANSRRELRMSNEGVKQIINPFFPVTKERKNNDYEL